MVGSIDMGARKKDDEDEAGEAADPAVRALVSAQRESGMSWSAIGEKLGYRHGYQEVMKIRKGTKDFRPELRRKIAEIMGLPEDAFDVRPISAAQQRQVDQAFAEFMETDVAKKSDPVVIASLRRLQLLDGVRPSVALFQTFALTMQDKLSLPSGEVAKTVAANVSHREQGDLSAMEVDAIADAADKETRARRKPKTEN